MLRQEIKFITNSNKFKNIISNFNLNKLYKSRMIYSIYFDTHDYKLFRLSEEGVSPRYKVRLRSYDFNFHKVNLEIKKTKNYLREKIVVKDFFYNKNSLRNNLIKLGITENLYPILQVSYERKYYNSYFGRITFDTNIKYTKVNENLKNILPNSMDTFEILEVKNNNQYDKYQVMQLLNLKETRFSKYCQGINKIIFY